jgi:hypothetical protein
VALIQKEGDLYSLAFDTTSGAFLEWIKDLLAYGLQRFASEFYGDNGLLKLYGSYTGSKSYMALNNSNMFRMTGVETIRGHLCLYITLNKDSQPEERLKYKDKFLSNKILQWESQTGTTLDNLKGKKLIQTGSAEIFVRKTKTEDGLETPFRLFRKGSIVECPPERQPRQSIPL